MAPDKNSVFHKLITLLFLICSFTTIPELHGQNAIMGECDNLGFVDGDLAPWRFFTGCHPNARRMNTDRWRAYCHLGGNEGCCDKEGRLDQGDNSEIDVWDARHTLMGGAQNLTDKFGKFDLVPPEIKGYPKSNFSVRLGNAIAYGEADQMERTFDITEDNAIFAYQFAFVLNDPTTGHLGGGEPYFLLPFFEAGIYNEEDEAIDCSHFIILANNDDLIVLKDVADDTVNSDKGCELANACKKMTVRYKEWTPVFMDLTDYIGEKLTIRFRNSDCALAGHWGYSYLSAFCGPYIPMEDTVICAKEPVTLKSPFPIEGFELKWSTGEETEEITVNPAVTTTYTLTVKNRTPFEGVENCEKPYEVTVTVIDGNPPVLADKKICIGGSVTFVAEPEGVDYEWYDAKTGGNLIFTGDRYTTPAIFVTTTYYVVNPAACAPKERVPVTVFVEDIEVDAGPDVTICSGDSAQLNASGGDVYSWTPPDGLSNTNIPNPKASPLVTTTYTVKVSDATGLCEGTDEVTVHVEEVEAKIEGPDVCIGFVTDFTNLTTPLNLTNASWKWDFGDNNKSDLKETSHTYAQPGTYKVLLSVAAGTCTDTTSTFVDVHPNPIAAFTATPRKTTVDNPLITFVDESVGADKGTWDFGDNLIDTYVPGEDKTHVYYATNEGEGPFEYTITLSVESEFGCKDKVTHSVEIENAWIIYVPNSFTPDGDGINDYFKAYGMGILDFKMTVFNRWGEVVYRSNDLNDGWDGTPISGNGRKQDVYVWKVKAMNNKGKVIKLIGHVSLLPGKGGS